MHTRQEEIASALATGYSPRVYTTNCPDIPLYSTYSDYVPITVDCYNIDLNGNITVGPDCIAAAGTSAPEYSTNTAAYASDPVSWVQDLQWTHEMTLKDLTPEMEHVATFEEISEVLDV